MSDRESKACEDYQAFSLLRSRFGGTKKPPPPPPKRTEKRKRRDPRFEAPPLKPLVEESDVSALPAVTKELPVTSTVAVASQCSQNEKVDSDVNGGASPRRNQKPSIYKPGAPIQSELDSLETASETSQSSAYFSLTPSLGSVTELSDTSSIDSFNEYDIKGKTGVRTAHLRATFEHPHHGMLRHHSAVLRSRHSSQALLHRTRRPCSAGSEHRPPLAQVSVKIPPSNPQSNSLENLLVSSSKESLPSREIDSSEHMWNIACSKHTPGRFVSRQSSMAFTSHKINSQVEDDESTDGSLTPHASQENDTIQNVNDETGIISRRVSVSEVRSPQFAQVLVVEKAVEKVHPQPIVIQPSTSSSCAWVRAQQRYRLMKQKSVDDLSRPSTTVIHEEPREADTEPTQLSMVEERARVFGGIQKRGLLRRTKSFQIGPCHTANITTRFA